MTTITKARIHQTANLARCDLARARRRAGLTLSRVHSDDLAWRSTLARDHFNGAQAKWREFLAAKGESRAVSRYEFLADFDAWIHASPVPDGLLESRADLFIVGMFGSDAIMVSRAGKGASKFYRILRNETDAADYNPLLRLPRTESVYLAPGDEATGLPTSDSSDDRMVCGYDTLLVVARQTKEGLRYRVIEPGERLLVAPFWLDQMREQFVPASQLLRQAKSALRSLDPASTKARQRETRLYRATPRAQPATVVLDPSEDLDKTKLVEETRPPTNHAIEIRPSISDAINLAQTRVMVFSHDLQAIEAEARAISERLSEVIEGTDTEE